mmetsp:Transcript_12161/g.29463  ORF Transcript_12161/g.29463 Transcript_12161/m.29463 type:complete len:707 (-) Transcript_12161:415-2535(-)
MHTVLELASGVALWASPPQVKIPALAALGVIRALRSRARVKRQARPREAAVELRWTDVSMTLAPKNTKANKTASDREESEDHSSQSKWEGRPTRILDGVSGVAKPGRLLAIMGPSGSGKTSLLNTLAMQVPANKRLTLVGALTANGGAVGRGGGGSGVATHRTAYVQQEDVFYSQLTVEETLTMAAKLRMAAGTSRADRDTAVSAMLNRLGLAHVRDSRVGDKKTRGISGGEKKRLSLACELVGHSPAVVCADEPTSGLDSFQAQRVMESLRELAREEGRTVVCSIHQPRGSIVALFDDVLLMAGGRVIYMGPMSDAAAWFSARGHPIPTNCNPAEFLIDLVSVDTSSAAAEAASRARLKALADACAEAAATVASSAPLGANITKATATSGGGNGVGGGDGGGDDMIASFGGGGGGGGGVLKQFALLLQRSWRQVSRDSATNSVRLATSLNSAFVFGSIFWRMGRSQTSIQDRMGLLQVSVINAAMAALMKTLTAFTKEKVIVDRERASGAYTMFPYLAAKLTAELPVGAFFPLAFGLVVYPMAGLHPTLGRFAKFCALITLESFTSSAIGLCVSSVAPSTEAAVAMGPAIMVLFIVFGGYYVNADNVPVCFKWINKCSVIKWAFQGLCINEFEGLEFEVTKASDQWNGAQVLDRLSFSAAHGNSVGTAATQQVNVAAFCYLSTLYLLEKSSPKFQFIDEVAALTS